MHLHNHIYSFIVAPVLRGLCNTFEYAFALYFTVYLCIL